MRATATATSDRTLTRWMLVVGVVAAVAALAGIDARATYGARVTADEPQYLLTAISLGEDGSLDISDELADERFRPFHEVRLNQQTVDLDADGRRVSPHDPLLPLLLAFPVRVGGWVGAKIALALVGAVVAALTLRLAVSRLGAPTRPAALVVGGFAAAPPFSAYGVQVYPAMPAALCVLIGVLALTAAPRTDRSSGGGGTAGGLDWTDVAVVGAVVALPWLSVKYVPMAAVLAAAGLWRSWRARGQMPVATLAVYGVAGLSYLMLHQVLYGGWTAYATGDHFVDGEFLVVGSNPDYIGRSRRLIGLVIDRGFGLAAWNPAYLIMFPALVWLGRSRWPGRFVLLVVFAAGWGTATWIALTMHGWWWPGRQVVPVLPLAVAAVAAMIGQLPRQRSILGRTAWFGLVLASALGTVSWLFLAWEASTDRRTLVVDFEQTANPWYQLWRLVLPDHRRMDPTDIVLTTLWTASIGLACLAVFRWTGPSSPGGQFAAITEASTDESMARSIDDGGLDQPPELVAD